MTIDVLPSGKYRVRLSLNGKRTSRTFDHEPTKKELNALLVDSVLNDNDLPNMTLQQAFNRYIADKSNVLSPSTINGYKPAFDRLSPVIKIKKLKDIDSQLLQREINNLAKTYKWKTIKHTATVVKTVVSYYDPSVKINVTLPKKPKEEDIQIILKEAEGTMFEIPIKLACFGLRVGEITALTVDDVKVNPKGASVTINKAKVRAGKGKWVVKPPKTTESNRTVPIDKNLAMQIIKQGYVYNGYPASITDYLYKVEEKYGLSTFSIHKFRHYFCSKCIDLGIDFLTIQKLGGWSSLNTIQKVYAHVMNEDKKGDAIVNAIGGMINGEESGHDVVTENTECSNINGCGA